MVGSDLSHRRCVNRSIFCSAGYLHSALGSCGVLLLTASRMIDYRALSFHMKATRFDAIIVVATILSAIFVSIEYCVLIGVMLSFFMYIPRAAKLHVSELMVSTNRVVREVRPGDQRVRFIEYIIWKANYSLDRQQSELIFDRIKDELTPDVRVVLIRLKRARNSDAVCLKLLSDFIDQLKSRNVVLMLSGVHESMRKSFENVGIIQKLGVNRVFVESPEIWSSTIQAVRQIYLLLGRRIAASAMSPTIALMSKKIFTS